MTRALFHLVLHGHLPYVVGHGTWPHGEVWLQEAAAETYIPLLQLLSDPLMRGLKLKLTVNFSPVLLEQLSHGGFRERLGHYLEEQLKHAERERREYGERDPVRAALAEYWARVYRGRLDFFDSIGGDIVGAFRSAASEGGLEVISCAATHGYLPLLLRDECVRAQVKLGLMTSRRHMGSLDIKGFWLPECAYRASYDWTPPLPGYPGSRRAGLEMILRDEGVSFSYVEPHLLTGQPLLGLVNFGLYAEDRVWFEDELRERVLEEDLFRDDPAVFKPYYGVSPGFQDGIVFVLRDPLGTARVWSKDGGFPGDGRYLEFHKRAFPGGHRFWRVTDRRLGLGEKEYYDPAAALQAVREHASLYFEELKVRASALHAMGLQSVLFAEVFDAELFGHWWYEGVVWLGELFRLISADPTLEPVLGSDVLSIYDSLEVVHLWEGSWGAGGDHRIWFNRETRWMWEEIYRCEELAVGRLAPIEPRDELHERVLNQLFRELLLLEASDWEFLFTTWQARDYAEMRFLKHLRAFDALARMAVGLSEGETPSSESIRLLERLERDDFLFPHLDYRWWRGQTDR